MGHFIVLDGLDGSGKGTQSELLAASLAAEGRSVKLISFPHYGTPGAAAVEFYLGGKLGADPAATNAYAASTFYAVDRYLSFRTEWGDFLAMLPTSRSRNYDSFLSKRGDVQKMSSDGVVYYFQIKEVLNKGDIQPLELARETIARVLSTQRQSEAIKGREEVIKEQALANGHARIYKSTED